MPLAGLPPFLGFLRVTRSCRASRSTIVAPCYARNNTAFCAFARWSAPGGGEPSQEPTLVATPQPMNGCLLSCNADSTRFIQGTVYSSPGMSSVKHRRGLGHSAKHQTPSVSAPSNPTSQRPRRPRLFSSILCSARRLAFAVRLRSQFRPVGLLSRSEKNPGLPTSTTWFLCDPPCVLRDAGAQVFTRPKARVIP